MRKKRLKKLLNNALSWINDECDDFFVNEVDNEYEWFEQAIGITEKELTELGITLRLRFTVIFCPIHKKK